MGLLALLVFMTVAVTKSADLEITSLEKAHLYTRHFEFDYISWTLNAVRIKVSQSGIKPNQFLTQAQQKQVVLRYIELTSDLENIQWEIQQIYSNPSVKNPEIEAKEKTSQQEDLQTTLANLGPIAESILQSQVSETILKMGIPRVGEVLPPVLFHTSPLPKALIVSPRDKIQQDVNTSLLVDLTLEQITLLEHQVETATDSSALVVNVGGIGVYPTMVMRSSNIAWSVDTIAHEWIHNYLTLRLLGLNYETTPELRTMNETAAAIAGTEISQELMKTYYPELLASAPDSAKLASLKQTDPFNFQVEMHATRLRVDELLKQGKITEAEQYMEERRLVFVNHGYMIRRLNQAYFAFYGAYAQDAIGPAGKDPVGEAVRTLRTESPSLATFLRKIAWMDSYQDLKLVVGK
jgi:hypothetical protein